MHSSPQAQRTSARLAKIAQINEKRALAAVVQTQRRLDEQSALRDSLRQAQRDDEEALFAEGQGMSAGLLQMITGSRQAHAKRLQELDNAMGDTAIELSQRRNVHEIARSRQRVASNVAERVTSARRQALLKAQQKVDDDLSVTRFGHGPPSSAY